MRPFFTLMLVLCCCMAHAQREFAVCDSTFYPFNADSTIIAGRYRLYMQTSSGINMLHNFATSDTDVYIRDFDMARPDKWYVVTGLRYIGGPTTLYRSDDRGQSWVTDTSFYPVMYTSWGARLTYYNSINQMQRLGQDTLVLFIGYYQSALVYSTNGGNSWQFWFENMIVHYQGLLECDNHYFLYSFEGDAFRPWMFPFHKSLLFSPDTGTAWSSFSNNLHATCSGTSNPRCIYGPTSISRCTLYNYFVDTLASSCATLPAGIVETKQTANALTIAPNPATDNISIQWDGEVLSAVRITDAFGRTFSPPGYLSHNGVWRINTAQLPAGHYMIQAVSRYGLSATGRLLVER